MSVPRKSAAARLEAHTQFDPNSGCWLYEITERAGYGKISIGKTGSVLAHRASFEIANGPIPTGLFIDHKCRTRSCVNPAHLRAVTPTVNSTENSTSPPALNRLKTHCKHGHEFTPENTRVVTYRHRKLPSRQCRACARLLASARRRGA